MTFFDILMILFWFCCLMQYNIQISLSVQILIGFIVCIHHALVVDHAAFMLKMKMSCTLFETDMQGPY